MSRRDALVSTFRTIFSVVLLLMWAVAIFAIGSVFDLVLIPAAALGLTLAVIAFKIFKRIQKSQAASPRSSAEPRRVNFGQGVA